MAQNYAKSTLKKIDERFSLESVTSDIINNGIRLDFSGVNTVTIYNVDTVPETDYVRSGYSRFGQLVELGTGVQDFTLSQDKAFTFSVDRGNLEDSMGIQEVNLAVRRQVREVSIPTTDIYRLNVLYAYAVANSQTATAALTKTGFYAALLVQYTALIDAEVPTDNLVIYTNGTNAAKLALDPEYKLSGDDSYRDNKTGLPSRALGMTLKIVPTSYLPAACNFMIVAKNVLISPTKFNMIRVLSEVLGIDGWVAEGRRYYDAFVSNNKGVAIRVHKSS